MESIYLYNVHYAFLYLVCHDIYILDLQPLPSKTGLKFKIGAIIALRMLRVL